LALLDASFDVLAFTESKLCDGVNSSEIFPSEYFIFRRDRNKKNSNKDSGGGVLIAIKDSLECEEVKSPENLEQICVKIKKI
jgi:hypothetical protein